MAADSGRLPALRPQVAPGCEPDPRPQTRLPPPRSYPPGKHARPDTFTAQEHINTCSGYPQHGRPKYRALLHRQLVLSGTGIGAPVLTWTLVFLQQVYIKYSSMYFNDFFIIATAHYWKYCRITVKNINTNNCVSVVNPNTANCTFTATCTAHLLN